MHIIVQNPEWKKLSNVKRIKNFEVLKKKNRQIFADQGITNLYQLIQRLTTRPREIATVLIGHFELSPEKGIEVINSYFPQVLERERLEKELERAKQKLAEVEDISDVDKMTILLQRSDDLRLAQADVAALELKLEAVPETNGAVASCFDTYARLGELTDRKFIAWSDQLRTYVLKPKAIKLFKEISLQQAILEGRSRKGDYPSESEALRLWAKIRKLT